MKRRFLSSIGLLLIWVGSASLVPNAVAAEPEHDEASPSLPYIPEPKPVSTPILVGAHHCPLWEADKPQMWDNVLKHPERTPSLGFYAQENPEVADWETKWAVEHGVSFFIYCWYRASQGEPVKMRFGSAIHDALFKSKFVDKMKFTIMWENQSRGVAGTFDGETMRIYVDGREQGSMRRAGPLRPNAFHLCLGSYEVDHAAHFDGLLDEVKLYARALTAEEIRAHHASMGANR